MNILNIKLGKCHSFVYLHNSSNNFCLICRCPHCGTSFTIAQELTTHLRLKQCKFEENPENSLRCEKCPFSSNSSSELLFHEALHDDPVETIPTSDSETKVRAIHRYKCPVCSKYFPKASLLGHIRQHTQERPFVCKLCDKSFARKNNLQYHMNNHERRPAKPKSTATTSRDRLFLCSTCGSSFRKR